MGDYDAVTWLAIGVNAGVAGIALAVAGRFMGDYWRTRDSDELRSMLLALALAVSGTVGVALASGAPR